ncbi:unnamed protein product [Cylindrotheca closterium]|uniref:Transmembrane protein 242 n=1 Tax=Cylindrotheca closterium TaxID=2856 RepID=A0AAD2CT84_9STRA|nr:unnamed protein product [Cylindrotheca closterium]
MSDNDDANKIAKNIEEWNVEDSFLWWTQHPFLQNPWNILGISGCTVVAGAFFGYKKPTKKLQKLVDLKKVDAEKLAGRREMGFQAASRALRIATIGTVGTFGVVAVAGFYASGYRSFDALVNDTRAWGEQNRQSFEDWLGIENRPSKTDPEAIATKNMTEEEELNYIYERHLKDAERIPDNSFQKRN